MDNNVLEKIIANSIKIGVINTLSKLGLYEEQISEKQAHKMYGEKRVKTCRR